MSKAGRLGSEVPPLRFLALAFSIGRFRRRRRRLATFAAGLCRRARATRPGNLSRFVTAGPCRQ
eukprot:391140-Lingulodinium_polyedra.AAC.1